MAVTTAGATRSERVGDEDVLEFPTRAEAAYVIRPAEEADRPLPAYDWTPPAFGPREAYGRRIGIGKLF